jgi:hypothetical protein
MYWTVRQIRNKKAARQSIGTNLYSNAPHQRVNANTQAKFELAKFHIPEAVLPRSHWSSDEHSLLMELAKAEGCPETPKNIAWTKISSQLAQRGFNRSWTACKQEWSNHRRESSSLEKNQHLKGVAATTAAYHKLRNSAKQRNIDPEEMIADEVWAASGTTVL